jgi:hypothetical protein
MTARVFGDTNVLLTRSTPRTARSRQARPNGAVSCGARAGAAFAAAKTLDCRLLLTGDLSHGQDLDGVRVVSPFRVAPSELRDESPSET